MRFLEWISVSPFGGVLWERFAAWQRGGWERIVAIERFRLRRPRYTVPEIEEVLEGGGKPRGFVARLLLVACDAVDVVLDGEYRNRLRQIVDEGESSR